MKQSQQQYPKKKNPTRRNKKKNLINRVAKAVEAIHLNPRPRKMNGKRAVYTNQVLANKRFAKSEVTSMINFKSAAVKKHLRDLMSPFNAKDARLPSFYENYSSAVKIKSSFTLVTNAGGFLTITIDPDYLPSTTQSTYMYNNDVSLNGVTATTTTWKNLPLNCQPVAPTGTFSKYRLVSAGLKATVKLSSNNIVGTAYSCIAYENIAIGIANAASQNNPNYDQYNNYSTMENGNSGNKFDITGEHTSVSLIWLPVDNLSATFLAIGGEIDDQLGNEAGAYQKWVMGFSGLPATTNIMFDICLNWEVIPTGANQAWVGGSNEYAPTIEQHSDVMSVLKKSGNYSESYMNTVHQGLHDN
jgi:hypothetical protein